MKTIKILIADDSGFMRLLIADMLSNAPDFQIVDTAANGKEAFEKTLELKPDIVLLDFEMGEYSGLYAIKNIMDKQPTPIVIFSALGNIRPEVAMEVLEAGAAWFMTKPISSKLREKQEPLIEKIRELAAAKIENLGQRNIKKNENPHTFDLPIRYKIIAFGASTGGTGALESILQRLPSNLPVPVVIAQHIPEKFIHSLAKRLDDLISLPVKVAKQGESLKDGTVYFAPAENLIIQRNLTTKVPYFTFSNEVFEDYNAPSINALFLSVAEIYPRKAVGIILTGMGKDGAVGLKAIKDAGGFTIAQDEASSVIFGMPKAAIEINAAAKVLSLSDIPSFIVNVL